MRALKFLEQGGVGRFSRFVWPLPAEGAPGAWVESAGDTLACLRGVHACAPEHLPFWLGPELYVIELGGEIQRAEHKVVAERGRLLRRVEAWDAARQRAFAEAAALQARDVAAAILRAEGEGALAERLGACAGVAELAAVVAGAPPEGERSRRSLEYLGDALRFASSAPNASAYCAAHAGLDQASYLAARASQARWLAGALGLDAALAS